MTQKLPSGVRHVRSFSTTRRPLPKIFDCEMRRETWAQCQQFTISRFQSNPEINAIAPAIKKASSLLAEFSSVTFSSASRSSSADGAWDLRQKPERTPKDDETEPRREGHPISCDVDRSPIRLRPTISQTRMRDELAHKPAERKFGFHPRPCEKKP